MTTLKSTMSIHPLVMVTDEELRKVRVSHNVDNEEKLRDNIKIIKEWCQKQPHFVEKNFDNQFLEKWLLLSNGSPETAKIRLDKFCTTRGMMPEISLNRQLEEFDNFHRYMGYVVLPKLNPSDQSRVMVTYFHDTNFDGFDLLTYFRYAFMIGEYRLTMDCTISERYIIDLKHTSLQLLGKVNPVLLKKAEVLATEGFGTKIKGIHLLNAPTYVDKLVFLLKQALKEKVASRLFVHNSYEDLHKHIPKEILPHDYNGDEQSLSKLTEQWRDEMRTPEARRFTKYLENVVSEEALRPSGKFNEEYMGMPGSFRKLNVD